MAASLVKRQWYDPMKTIGKKLCLRNTISLLGPTVFLSVLLLSYCGMQAGEIIIAPAVEANLRHDKFGRDYTNLYGNSELYANLNLVNDDRAVLEFPMVGLPQNSVITSASLTVLVYAGGGTQGATGTFVWYGYTGDGSVSMSDYYQQRVMLKSFNEGVPPAYGYTSFDVTAFVKDQYNAGTAYDGFLLQALSQDVLVGFAGPGSSYPQPTLKVAFAPVPEPNAALFVGVSAAVLVWHRRIRSFWHGNRSVLKRKRGS
jgi:hypothetical protein